MDKPVIEVITTFYNDSFLAPFFLNHYSWADRIRAVIDSDTIDGTEEIVRMYSNTHVEYIRFPGAYDDEMLTARWNAMYAESDADWVIGVSSDEFVFPPTGGMHEYLRRQTHDIVFVRLYQVYRHETESDLDPDIPIHLQRRHADPDVVKGQNRGGMKPIVVRTGLRRLKWMPGTHNVWNKHRYDVSEEVLTGAHWHMADPGFCIDHRLGRRDRMSMSDIAKGHGYHNVGITRESLLEECRQHEHDPEVF